MKHSKEFIKFVEDAEHASVKCPSKKVGRKARQEIDCRVLRQPIGKVRKDILFTQDQLFQRQDERKFLDKKEDV